MIRDKRLREHLAKEHNISVFSEYLKEIVYGASDGIITTFAVVAGFAGAGHTSGTLGIGLTAVLLFGFANLAADGFSMALGNFLSVRSEQKLYRLEREKEEHEIQHSPELEEQETISILMEKGYSQEQAAQLTSLFMLNQEFWADFMLSYELGISNPEGTNPYLTGLATFFSFISFGLIPLLPYLAKQNLVSENTIFSYSILFTLLALLLLGILRFKITKESWIKSISETMLLGSLAATIAYIVGLNF